LTVLVDCPFFEYHGRMNDRADVCDRDQIYGGLDHLWVREQSGFDFVEFETVAAGFDLPVLATVKVEVSVGTSMD
jgi:hypothetical protein